MDAYEQIVYLARLAIIIVCVAAIAVIFFFGMPQLNPDPLYADVMAGQVATGADFWESPGVIAAERFTPTSTDVLSTESAETPLLFVVRTNVMKTDLSDQLIPSEIIYNRRGWSVLEPIMSAGNIRGLSQETWRMPVTVKHTDGRREPGILVMEVIHD